MNRLKLTYAILILWGVCFFKLPIGVCQTNVDSLGTKLLQEAADYRAVRKLEEANQSALLAIDFFRKKEDWEGWTAGYESIYLNARKGDQPSDLSWAIDRFENAEELLKQTPAIDDQFKVKIYGFIAYLYQNLGQYWEAITYYKKVFKSVKKVEDDTFELKMYASAGTCFWMLGDDQRALGLLDKALTMAYQGGESDGVLIYILNNLANVWRTTDPVQSIPLYQKSLQLNPNDPETHMLLSKAYLEANLDAAKALQAAQKAWELAIYDYQKSDALHQLGRVYFHQDQYDKALASYDKALPFAEAGYGKKHPECVKIHFFRGNTFLDQKKFDAAFQAYNEVLNLLLPLFTPTSIHQHPTKEEATFNSLWIIDALAGKSDCYRNRFIEAKQIEDLEKSLELLELGIFLFQKMKLKYGDDESKYQLNDKLFYLCGRAMSIAFKLEKETGNKEYLEKAFSIGAQTKAIVLSETLHRKELKKLAGVPDSLLKKERDCYANIAHWEKKLFNEENIDSIATFKDSLFFAQRALESFESELEELYPDYAEAKFGYKQPSIDDVQQELAQETGLMEYFMADTSIFSFLITKDTFWVFSTPRPKDFKQDVTTFLRTLSDWEYVEDSSAVASDIYLDYGWTLYQELLEKPLSLVEIKKLIIVPDEILSSIPFEVLLSQPYAGNWIDRDVPYLLNDYNISYRFSSVFSPPSNDQSMDDWGGFGLEFNDPKEVEYLNEMEDAIVLRNEGRLLHAADEILNSADFFGGATWLNDEATRENFLENAEKFEILHLATHAVVDQKDPLRSKIIFSQSIIDEDAAVYAHEIYGMQLKAGLTVLSACSSGRGTWKRGEGMMSLARAFTYAGCPSVVMSLWNVSDKSTSILMIDFYKYLKEGHSKDEALRLAKMDYLKSTSSEYTKPIYWASFVAVGDISPIQPIDDSWSLYYKIILGLLALLLVYFMVSRSNKAS